MAGGGQDRACALGWGEVIHPNRPKTVARYHTIPQISYECFNLRSAMGGECQDFSRRMPTSLDMSEYICRLHILVSRLVHRRKEWLPWRRPARLLSS